MVELTKDEIMAPGQDHNTFTIDLTVFGSPDPAEGPIATFSSYPDTEFRVVMDVDQYNALVTPHTPGYVGFLLVAIAVLSVTLFSFAKRAFEAEEAEDAAYADIRTLEAAAMKAKGKRRK